MNNEIPTKYYSKNYENHEFAVKAIGSLIDTDSKDIIEDLLISHYDIIYDWVTKHGPILGACYYCDQHYNFDQTTIILAHALPLMWYTDSETLEDQLCLIIASLFGNLGDIDRDIIIQLLIKDVLKDYTQKAQKVLSMKGGIIDYINESTDFHYHLDIMLACAAFFNQRRPDSDNVPVIRLLAAFTNRIYFNYYYYSKYYSMEVDVDYFEYIRHDLNDGAFMAVAQDLLYYMCEFLAKPWGDDYQTRVAIYSILKFFRLTCEVDVYTDEIGQYVSHLALKDFKLFNEVYKNNESKDFDQHVQHFILMNFRDEIDLTAYQPITLMHEFLQIPERGQIDNPSSLEYSHLISPAMPDYQFLQFPARAMAFSSLVENTVYFEKSFIESYEVTESYLFFSTGFETLSIEDHLQYFEIALLEKNHLMLMRALITCKEYFWVLKDAQKYYYAIADEAIFSKNIALCYFMVQATFDLTKCPKVDEKTKKTFLKVINVVLDGVNERKGKKILSNEEANYFAVYVTEAIKVFSTLTYPLDMLLTLSKLTESLPYVVFGDFDAFKDSWMHMLVKTMGPDSDRWSTEFVYYMEEVINFTNDYAHPNLFLMVCLYCENLVPVCSVKQLQTIKNKILQLLDHIIKLADIHVSWWEQFGEYCGNPSKCFKHALLSKSIVLNRLGELVGTTAIGMGDRIINYINSSGPGGWYWKLSCIGCRFLKPLSNIDSKTFIEHIKPHILLFCEEELTRDIESDSNSCVTCTMVEFDLEYTVNAIMKLDLAKDWVLKIIKDAKNNSDIVCVSKSVDLLIKLYSLPNKDFQQLVFYQSSDSDEQESVSDSSSFRLQFTTTETEPAQLFQRVTNDIQEARTDEDISTTTDQIKRLFIGSEQEMNENVTSKRVTEQCFTLQEHILLALDDTLWALKNPDTMRSNSNLRYSRCGSRSSEDEDQSEQLAQTIETLCEFIKQVEHNVPELADQIQLHKASTASTPK